MRFGYEFDGPWNHYDSEQYKTAWRRMYDKKVAAGADNIIMVWQSATYCTQGSGQVTYQGKNIEAWYPGDEYVDWMGMSYFAPNDCNGVALSPLLNMARQKNKPVMIAESAPQRYDLSANTYNPQVQRKAPDQQKTGQQIWNEWFTHYFKFIDDNSDVIKTVAYINADWDSQGKWASPYPEGYWGDSRVESNRIIQDLWLSEVQGSDWLNASEDLFEILGGATPPPTPCGVTNKCSPPPPPPFGNIKVEAESGQTFGQARTYNDGAASGGQGVAYLLTNSGVTFSSPIAAENIVKAANITIRYASEQSGTISVYVNGQDNTVTFNSTGSWVGNYQTLKVSAWVHPGDDVEIRADTGDSAMNIDFIELTDFTANTSNVASDSQSMSLKPMSLTPVAFAPSETLTIDPVSVDVSEAMTILADNNDAPYDGMFGVESDGTLWYAVQPDWPTTGTFYLCRDGENDCYPAERQGNRWQYTFSQRPSGIFTSQLKVPGLGADQFPRYEYSWSGSAPPQDDVGNDNPQASGFENLDWTFNSHNSEEKGGFVSWRVHNDNKVAPDPRTRGPEYLATPMNGAEPTSHGFAFDIRGNRLSWRWGPNLFKGAGDSGLEMHCSEDNAMTYQKVSVSNGSATIPCSGEYVYFFRYRHPLALNNDEASAWIYTGGFTTKGARVNPKGYTGFTDSSANWMRFRHPVSHDGTTAAILDAQHNTDRLRNLDRYTIWVDDQPGNVELNVGVTGSIVRNDVHRNNAGNRNGQQQFSLSQNPGFENAFSYGQVIQFELTAVAGATGAQTYNDFSYYTVGYGFGAYGDPRLNVAGRAGTTMWFSDAGTYSDLEYNAVFTQPFTTIYKEQDVDDFLVGHHLFHGVDPKKQNSIVFDDPDVQMGATTCGHCHFRDGRGTQVFDTPKGPRLPMPNYGVKLLEAIDGREAGFTWDGSIPTVADQVLNALEIDHKVDFNEVDKDHPAIQLVTQYVEMLTVPNRNPSSYDIPSVAEGDVLFNQIGCSDCHTPVQKTRSSEPHLDNLTIRPYTDMKLWDLGEGAFRTPALWGLGHNITLLDRNGLDLLFMHDGASTTIMNVISRHNGDASDVKSRFNGLSVAEKQNIVKFVRTL